MTAHAKKGMHKNGADTLKGLPGIGGAGCMNDVRRVQLALPKESIHEPDLSR
jgi:hypothetical protein